MRALVSAVTLGVRDVAASRRFYIDGLGMRALLEIPGEIFFIQIAAGQMLALWNAESMRSEYGDVALPAPGAPGVPISLGQNVDSAEEVDRAIDAAVAAGATLVQAPAKQSWGGYSGCFADPDGYRWDVVFNPGFHVAEDGTVRIEAIEEG